jgi:hypothetical protein
LGREGWVRQRKETDLKTNTLKRIVNKENKTTIMENLELDNKAENVTKTTKKEVKVTVVPKESKFVTAETIKLVEDILNDGTVDIKWRAQLKEQVRKYKGHGE